MGQLAHGPLKRYIEFPLQILPKFLDGRTALYSAPNNGLYEFKGRLKVDQLLSGIVVTPSMVAVRGFDTSCNRVLTVGLNFEGAVRLVA